VSVEWWRMIMQDNVDARMHGGAAVTAKPVTLALQGGGAHGAFSWGVVDGLLEDGRLDIEAISATSAGAMNAAVMAYGMSVGGVDGARAKLAEFWRAISDAGQFYSPFRAFPWARWLEAGGMCNDFMPMPMAFQTMTQLFSPYQLNPFNLNPLKDVLDKVVDFERLRQCPGATRLYLSATNVRTGKIKVFENKELTTDAVMASACLPTLFQAVAINGEHYWDGGFMGNPAIFPLIYRSGSRDVVIVHINPLERKKLPTTAPEIFNRMNEIAFNSSLMREMRAVTFVTTLIDEGALDPAKYARINMHSINDDAALEHLGAATKLNPDWEFLCLLRDAGRSKAQKWLATNFDAVGTRSSVNLAEVYL
jgi:NTE family protein